MRSCTVVDKDKWIAFLDECFEYAGDGSYGVDFAPLFTESALKKSKIIEENSSIVSSGTLFTHKAVTAAGILNVGVIGAVATHKNFRGKGYSKEIIEALISDATQMGLDMVVLWSDLKDHYEKLGFKAVGTQEIYSIRNFIPSLKEEGTLESVWDLAAVSYLYNQHSSRMERSASYWQDIEMISSCLRFQWRDRRGDIVAYVGIGKGKDLAGVIHEWGGSSVGLQSLVAALKVHADELLWLTHPQFQDPVRASLVSAGEKALLSSELCLCKNISGKSLDSILAQLWFWGLDSM